QLAECYERALRLMQEKDYSYAETLLAECVLRDPGNLKYVETWLQSLQAKFSGSKKRMVPTPVYEGARALKKAVAHKQWQAVFGEGIALLKFNPWNVVGLRSLAEACAQLHFNEVELVYLKQALDADPKNLEVNRHCA